jgi:hypothetical protein
MPTALGADEGEGETRSLGKPTKQSKRPFFDDENHTFIYAFLFFS